jgi:hypothetical protein
MRRRAGCRRRVEEALERPGARGVAGVVEADQRRGGRQPIEILGVERRRAIGLREGRIGFGPVLTVVAPRVRVCSESFIRSGHSSVRTATPKA